MSEYDKAKELERAAVAFVAATDKRTRYYEFTKGSTDTTLYEVRVGSEALKLNHREIGLTLDAEVCATQEALRKARGA